jgi:hypothetical protein
MTTAQVIAGTKAKSVGHANEHKVCAWLNTLNEGLHVVDGKPKTKQDIINVTTGKSYSLKSVSKNHTQCHLTSTDKWCNYFNISGNLKKWFDLFFGIPGEDVSEGKSRQHRLSKPEITESLNDLAISWFNDNKLRIFDVIVRRGMSDTPVNDLIWFEKSNGDIKVFSVNEIEELIVNGKWIMNDTTLHFIDENDNKLFHLQMKGSGKKYTSGYHGMMFHIYKPSID